LRLTAYQDLMIEHIAAVKRAAVWADMGSGKTVSTLTALERINETEDAYPALIVAPKFVASNVWPKEAQKWPHLQHLGVAQCLGTPEQRRRAFKQNANITTINFENLEWLQTTCGGQLPYKTIVVDESTRLKGFRPRQGAVRAKALAKMAVSALRFVELTGTPIPNGLEDLWGQVWFLDYGNRLGGSFHAFRNRWFQSDYMGFNWTPLPHAFEEVTDKVKDLCLTIKTNDWFLMDAPVVRDITVVLPPKARQHYEQMERAMFTELGDIGVEAFNAAAVTNKCLQIANGATYYDKDGSWVEVHDAKLEALESIVEEAGGAPILVSYAFIPDRERILKRFPKARTLGSDADIEAWNAGKVPLLVVHPGSAGHGLNLQYGGHRLVFFGATWNLEHYLQIIERIGPLRQKRAGFDRPVFVYRILAEDTMDQRVIEVLDGKSKFQDAVIARMKR
jgi:SNF2 family DNA or RNA helicase